MDKVVLKKKVVVDLKTDFAREGAEEEALRGYQEVVRGPDIPTARRRIAW